MEPDTALHPAECHNYPSATSAENCQTVEKLILEEIRLGRYVVTDTKPTIVSALGAVPKETPGELRVIHDASRPHGGSLNSHAIPEKFTMQNVDSALKLVTPQCWMTKLDLKNGYRICGISNRCYQATGLKWRFSGHATYTYMFDSRLPMGACKSPNIFQRLTQSVTRMMQRRGFPNVIVYQDDYFIAHPTLYGCQNTLNNLIELLHNLGFIINWKKVYPPSQQLVFLGVEIDSIKLQVRLPDQKVQQLKSEVIKWQCPSKSFTKRQLQHIIGKLSWAAKVIRTSRPFLRSLINLSTTLKKPWHRIRLSTEA